VNTTLENLARLCRDLEAHQRRSPYRIRVGRGLPGYEEQRFFEALAAALVAGASIGVYQHLEPGTILVVSPALSPMATRGRPSVHCASEDLRDTLLRLLAACSIRGPAS
jgi:hypothetical protein